MTIASADPSAPLPDSFAAFELVYFLELARTFTGTAIVPAAVAMPGPTDARAALADHFGTTPAAADRPRITLSAADAHRPLMSEAERIVAGHRARPPPPARRA